MAGCGGILLIGSLHRARNIPRINRSTASKLGSTVHNFPTPEIAEQSVTLPGGQLPDNAEAFQMAEAFVDSGRRNADFSHQIPWFLIKFKKQKI